LPWFHFHFSIGLLTDQFPELQWLTPLETPLRNLPCVHFYLAIKIILLSQRPSAKRNSLAFRRPHLDMDSPSIYAQQLYRGQPIVAAFDRMRKVEQLPKLNLLLFNR